MSLSIRQAIAKVAAGQIRIPAFQRGFVWDPERVAYLMDSIYKGYPFGSLILWRTKEQLRSERQLGPFKLPAQEDEYPVDYVLDGQQRLTAVFGVFQTDLSPEPDEDVSWMSVFFDFGAEADLQESQFVVLNESEADASRHFPIGTFFDPVKYRAATEGLAAERIVLIDQVQAAFQEASIATQMIETDDRGKVAIVFERVNRLGLELDTFQLLSAWTWSEDFDLQEEFVDLAEQLAPFGFDGIGEDTNLLLRCCSAVVADDVSAPGLLSLNGAEVRARFAEIANGLRGAIDFLRSEIGVAKLANLPYPSMLVPLTVFFADEDGKEVTLNDGQRHALVRWFWRSCFSKRFSGAVLRNLKRDLIEARNLRASGSSKLADIAVEVEDDWFQENRFTIGSVNTKTFILALAQTSPRSFVSGAKVNLGEVLSKYNRGEFHHLYPQRFLKSEGRGIRDINRLANFAVISAADNKTLGGRAPSEYKANMNHGNLSSVLSSATVPESLFDDDYDAFLIARASQLAELARKLTGLDGAGPAGAGD